MANTSDDPRAVASYEKACAEGLFANISENRAAYMKEWAVGIQKGAAAEKSRIFGIIDAPEADYRSKQAWHLAMTPDMSVADARKHLASMPADIHVEASTPDDDRARGAAAFAAARGTSPRPAAGSSDSAPTADAGDSDGDERQRGADAFRRARGV